MNAVETELPFRDVSTLLRRARLSEATKIISLPRGRNNRVYRIETKAGPFLFKVYFHHPDDPRDRLGHEFAFLRYLEESDCRFGPRPYASDPERHFGLMEFIEGQRLSTDEVTAEAVDEAGKFYAQINARAASPAARVLPEASEANFSIEDHLDRTARRVARLSKIAVEDEISAQAEAFARDELVPAWTEIKKRVLASVPKTEQLATRLRSTERCLSPCDFGFHNALRTKDGHIRFLDFEYAGWDDPAKLVCDFANQPDRPIPPELSERFRNVVLGESAQPDALAHRITLLEPVYQLKWACICLNDFFQIGAERLAFLEGDRADLNARRQSQLSLARGMFTRATTSSHGSA